MSDEREKIEGPLERAERLRANTETWEAEIWSKYGWMIAPQAWPFDLPQGWREIVEVLLFRLADKMRRYDEVVAIRERLEKKGEHEEWVTQYFEEHPDGDPYKGFQIVQVKQKFGGLRFYTNFTRPEIYGMISMAESLSYRTCEECGAPARASHLNGWYRTLCPAHAKVAGTRVQEGRNIPPHVPKWARDAGWETPQDDASNEIPEDSQNET